ncbi:hypothetical protein QZH41_014238 [Actinostola sp. cb2023]|nr:hypothetical protein QZH41_014238 [Actinostola sp. cb2023]
MEMEKEDHEDLSHMLQIIRLCLDLYCKNPHVLEPLRKFIRLPSDRTIRWHKNKIQQEAGWNDEILSWCMAEAKEKGLREQDLWGGFIIDEMKIQENLEMVVKNGKHKLVGFVNLGNHHDVMTRLSGENSKSEPELATQVLQFIYLSDCGFRCPIAQFPSGSCTPSDLYFIFWEGVRKMFEFNFVIYWCILDGADCNRQFIQIHFRQTSAVEKHFVTYNIHTGNSMVFIMDPMHNLKKIRNNIVKSNLQSKPRCLTFNGETIRWKQKFFFASP